MHKSSFSDIKEARLIFFGIPAPAISGDQLVSRVERLAHINGDLTFCICGNPLATKHKGN